MILIMLQLVWKLLVIIGFQLKLLIEQIQFIDNQVKECETKIKELMKKIDSPITTIPCIGAVVRKMCNIIYAVLKNHTPYEVPKQ